MTNENSSAENFCDAAANQAPTSASSGAAPRRNPQCAYFLPLVERALPARDRGVAVLDLTLARLRGRINGGRRCHAFALNGDSFCINHSQSLRARMIRAERVVRSLESRAAARTEFEALASSARNTDVMDLISAMARKIFAGCVSDRRANAFIKAARLLFQMRRD